jgi:hypothetical protein
MPTIRLACFVLSQSRTSILLIDLGTSTMFGFYSNQLGCGGSIVVSIILSVLLIVLVMQRLRLR